MSIPSPVLDAGRPDPRMWEAASAPARSGRQLTRRIVAGGAILVTLTALVIAGVGHGAVVRTGGVAQLGQFLLAAGHPRLDGQFLALTGQAAVTTVAYAALGTVLSLAIGVVGGVLSSQTWWRVRTRGSRRHSAIAGWMVARAVLVLPRGIHEVVWGLLFLSIFGLQPIVAVLAIGIPFGAVTAKVFSEILDETAPQPYEALIAAGARRHTAMLYGLLPPATSDLLSYGFYRFECAIRSATILGFIGAGGLGFQLQLSFQALQYGEIWTLLYALILLCAAADFWSAAVRGRRAVTWRGGMAGGLRSDRVLRASLLAVAVLVPASAWWVGLDLSVLWSGHSASMVGQLARQAWPPSIEDGLGSLLRDSASTLSMSVLAIALAFVGGTVLAFPAANLPLSPNAARHRSARRVLRLSAVAASRAVLIVLRAIPPPIWALLLLFVMYPGILPGAAALGIYTLGVLGRLMAEAAENLDRRPLWALCAHGAPAPHAFWYAVVPAAASRFTAYGLYRWEVTIRETVVVGVVGAGGLGTVLTQQLSTLDYSGATTTLATIVLLTLLVDYLSAVVRRSLR